MSDWQTSKLWEVQNRLEFSMVIYPVKLLLSSHTAILFILYGYVRFSAGAKNYLFSKTPPDRVGVYSASCEVVTGGCFSRILTAHIHLVRRLRMLDLKHWGSWKGTAVQRGLEPGSRGIAIVRTRYQAIASEDTASWKRLSECYSYL
jgi:hypothetical protein